MTDEVRAHPDNADGPFYVTDGCCTACGVPASSAPELFGWDDKDHCFVKRQPSTSTEVDQMFHAIRGAELDCIRYRGLHPDIAVRFAELGVPELCDIVARRDIRPVVRNQVTFVFAAQRPEEPGDLARALREHLLALDRSRNRATSVTLNHGCASFAVAWFEDHFHRIAVIKASEPATWLLKHEGNLGLSDWVHQWLLDLGATQLQWFANSDLNRSTSWRATPW